jgi:hypothetical protein
MRATCPDNFNPLGVITVTVVCISEVPQRRDVICTASGSYE